MISFRQYFNMNAAKNFYLCVTAAGVVVFLFYCLRINFFPTGMSLSDAIFFLLVIFSFSLLMGFAFTGWYSVSCVLVWVFLKVSLFICRITKRTKSKFYRNAKGAYRTARKMNLFEPMFALTIVSILIGFFVAKLVLDGKLQLLPVISSFLLVSLGILLIANVNFEKLLTREKKRKMTFAFVGFMVFIFLLFSGMGEILNDSAMRVIGVKKDDATFLLKDNDLEMARHLTGNSGQSFFYGDVLFTGVGDTSLLIINHKRLIVKNANLTISF